MEANETKGLHRQDLWSSQFSDSNAIIMPGKRKRNNNQSREQKHKLIRTKKNPVSKSQKRKKIKLEEGKEKTLMLEKTFEILERYKIPKSVYPLLQSSSSIGQGETKREKRRKAVQYFKAGLERPSDDRSFALKDADSVMCATDADLDQHQVKAVFEEMEFRKLSTKEKQVLVEPPDSLGASEEPIRSSSEINVCNATLLVKDDPSSLNKLLAVPVVVHPSRPKHIDDQRKDLPIVMMEQEIMEAINEHSAVIICGETGCGKTTQVPQFLYEAGYGSNRSIARNGVIGVTQPRRVAVLATAKRVALELGLHLGKEVGFQVRHDKKIGQSCSIKFMTDGILLREVQTDILLKRYSVIILDEAHERSLNTDILIGMLSRVIQLREKVFKEQQQRKLLGENLRPESMVFPLKVVLMSATLRVEDFVSGRRIFQCPPPVIEVPARQYPVTIHFSKRTEIVDYIGQAYKKVLSIHKQLPPGGILVFVTGQREVEYLCQKLRKASKERNSGGKIGNEGSGVSEMDSIGEINMKEIDEAFNTHGNSEHQQTDRFSSYEGDQGGPDEDDESDSSYDSQLQTESEMGDGDDVNSLNQDSLKVAFEAVTCKPTSVTNAASDGELKKVDSSYVKEKNGGNVLHAGALCVFPLYAMLPAAAQLRVFEEIKEGERLVVVATNVAETSLTIPGIKYVVDTGREKAKNYIPSNGMEKYEVQWISKASAAQRAGRAGRTGPGHCYRLYSSAVFSNIFTDFSVAEISKLPVDGIVLLMKSMGIDKVANFPFPTPPAASALVQAERCLKILEAVDGDGKLTSLGKAMARLPMSPRHSRMLLTVIQITKEAGDSVRPHLVLGYGFAAAAALSFSDPFIMQFDGDGEDQWKKLVKKTVKMSRAKFSNPSSDALTVAHALRCFELSGSSVEFCNEHALHPKNMDEMSKLRKQLLQLVFSDNPGCDGTGEDVEAAWRSSSMKNPLQLHEEEILCQAICAGWADRVARRSRVVSSSSEVDRKVNSARYQACPVKETVFLHRRSSISRSAPDFLVYKELLQSKRNRPYMHGATSVRAEWLVKYGRSLCSFSAPVTDPKPYYEPVSDEVLWWVSPTFGPHLWQLPLCDLHVSGASDRVAVFAYGLLDGQVLPCLKGVREFMSAPPGMVLRAEARGQRRVGNLLNRLSCVRGRRIDCCARLREAWEENGMELYSEILEWFQGSFLGRFGEIWAMMQREAVLEPRERFVKRVKRKKKTSSLAVACQCVG